VLILAIDPGPEKSGLVWYETSLGLPTHAAVEDNKQVLKRVRKGKDIDLIVIEMIASYGMPVGKTVFETCVFIGRLMEAFDGESDRITRTDVRLHICHSPRAADKNVRRALIDRFDTHARGDKHTIGTKKQPGPLYGISSHMWPALGLAVTWADQHAELYEGDDG
jgi:hypothetical protein